MDEISSPDRPGDRTWTKLQPRSHQGRAAWGRDVMNNCIRRFPAGCSVPSTSLA
ncbi:MAG: hypothetical protein RML36_11920 [Anaerolineae bacterium]|nr:hypothetical protein [Anaerolineae bacterium]